MKKLKLSFLAAATTATLALTVSGCNELSGRWNSSQDAFAPLSAEEASTQSNYSYVQANILDKYCTSCHGTKGGVNLESIAGVRKNAQAILRDMQNRSMPKAGGGGPDMTDADRRVLYQWVKTGSPVGTAAPLAPAGYPPLSPGDAADKLNYPYVQGKILIPYCMACHGDAGDISVENLDQIRAHASSLMKVIVSKKMPLGAAGKKMTPDDRAVLYNWLLQGAPVGPNPNAPVPQPFDNVHFPPLSVDDAKQKMNYGYIRDQILTPKCISCHGTSGHLSLENLPAVQKATKRILFAVFSVAATMPPFKPDAMPLHRALSDNDKQVFYTWLKAGAPAGTDSVTPVPPLPPVQPTFADIDRRIFQVRCMDCHDPASKLGQSHPLTKAGLLDPQDDAVKPGQPEASSLFQSLDQKNNSDPDSDPTPMPPTRRGYAPLPDQELQAIKDWILNGAKD